MKHLWKKQADSHWWEEQHEEITRRFGSVLAVVERPGRQRRLLEISCQTAKQAQALVREFGGTFAPLRPGWFRAYRKQARNKPIRVGSRLVIQDAPGVRVRGTPRSLVIPAEGAFGTGHHATTAFCLRILERITRPFEPGWAMLDAGTGSGVLALAGHCLGASRVVAIDNDPLACKTAKRNARANRATHIEILNGDILRKKLNGHFDIIAANLFSDLLIAALPIWSRYLAPDGHLILSGVLRSQETELVRALKKQNFRILETRRRGKWIAILCDRRGHGGKNR